MTEQMITYTPRAFQQDAQHAMKGNIVRGLIEAITNADDAYGNRSGKIRIEIERRKQEPWKVIVRDRASGMRASRMKEAIATLGARTSGFEEGRNVRGNLGRGAKDLAAFGPVSFESIRDGFLSTLVLKKDGLYEGPTERKANWKDYEALGIKHGGSGTVVTITVGKEIPCPHHENLTDRLSKHYQLRDIASDPHRELTLVDLNKNRADSIHYGRPSLEELVSSDLELPGYPGVSARLTIWRNADCYDNPQSDPGRPEGILIVGKKAIYENTLFRFESNPYSGWFSGRLECPFIDELARRYDEDGHSDSEGSEKNPMPIITRDRDGLVHEHPLFKALATAVEAQLEPLIRHEAEQAQRGPVKESARLRRTLDELGQDLGKLINEDLRELDAEGLTGNGYGADEFLVRVVPEEVVMYMGEDKTVSVLVARRLGIQQIEVEVDPEGIVEVLSSSPVILVEHPRREDYLIGRIKLRPLIEDDETYLLVRAGEEEAGALIDVRPERFEPEPTPPESFRFERERYHMTQGKRRRLKLQAPLDVVNQAGTQVRITSSNAGIAVLQGGQVDLEFDEDLLFFEGSIEVDPRVIGASGDLRASLGEFHADCKVTVGTFESGPRIDIKIENKLAGKFRAEVVPRADGSVLMRIFALHPALKRYLGPAPEFPLQDTPLAKIVLAEIIADEAARMVVERKFSSAGELDAAGFYSEHRQYLEKYLVRCHKMMLTDSEVSSTSARA